MAQQYRRQLLIFARNPEPGRVKTRLIPALGIEAATAIYRRMLRDTLASCSQLELQRCELWLDQVPPESDLAALLQTYDMPLQVQLGQDLGLRMHNAFVTSLRSADSAVLIGTDCPGYDPVYLEAAFRALTQQDAVIGPAADGGYVLIGLKKTAPSLFRDIPWGTDGVLAATREQLRRLHWNWSELPVRHDVDNPEDLERFPYLVPTRTAPPADGSQE